MKIPFPLTGIRQLAALAMALSFALPGAALAQLQWVSDGSHPVPYGPLTFDSVRARVVMQSPGVTHEHDGVSWSSASTSAQPPHLLEFHLVHDSRRQRAVLFSGSNNQGLNTETWEYDGLNWSLRSSSSPFVRPFGGCFHSGRGRVVVFGSDDMVSMRANDLWEWDGTSWQVIPTANSPWVGGYPSGASYGSMTYDPIRDVLVVFGSVYSDRHGRLSYAAETFEWDASGGWTPPQMLGGSFYGGVAPLAFDSQRGIQLLLSGLNGVPYVFERIGSANALWIPRTLISGFRFGPTVYDQARGQLVTLDPLTTSQWAYRPVNPARYEPHGSGCAGTLGTPRLRLGAEWTRAWLGGTLLVSIQGLPLDAAVLATGFTDQAWAGSALPLDLAARGLPGCLLRVAPEATLLVNGVQGIATAALPVPNQPALLGQTYFQQALSLDPGANVAGATMSNSMRGTIGSR